MSEIEKNLKRLGVSLPELPRSNAKLEPYYQVGNLLFLSGQGARDEQGCLRPGRVGDTYSTEAAQADARTIALQMLSIAKTALGDLERIRGVVKLLGLVNAIPEFRDHSKVIDGCSSALLEILGDRGRHTRSAIGVASLPAGLAVEIEAIFEVA